MKLAVLNPGGRDPEQAFPVGAGKPGESGHPPVNFHAYAACTQGGFHRRDEAVPEDADAVLVLVRGNGKAARQAILELRTRARRPLVISLKECGLPQVAGMIADRATLQRLQEICARVDGAVATTEELVPFYRGAGARAVEFIPTPYPVEEAAWDFSFPVEERRGIFLGTREFQVPARNHLAALLALKPLAESMGERVTVLNTEGWRGRRLLAQLRYGEGRLRVVEGRLPYPEYLRLLTQHKLVFQLDASAVPGQVAGDALLARVPCVGGNGAIERIAYPQLCGHGRGAEELCELAGRLLEHPHDCEAQAGEALDRAHARLSFSVVAAQLAAFARRLQ